MKRHQKSKIKRECLSHTEKAKKKSYQRKDTSAYISLQFFFYFLTS